MKFGKLTRPVKRAFFAMSYYNRRYPQIFKWVFNSKEDANFTYDLTEGNILYLAQTLAVVTGEDHRKIERYIHEARNHAPLREHIIRESMKSVFRKVADPRADYGKRLGWYAMARIMKPKVLVETGVDKGHGSAILCAALLENKKEGYEGRYYGTDINPAAGALLGGEFATMGEILYGDSIESLKKLNQPIDLFINDSDHSAEYEYREYLTIKDMMAPGGIILGDNSHVTDKLAVFSAETNRNFLFFREEPRDHWYPGGGIGISFPKK
ncbi:Methyltransferase domain-containing protein [Chitinophaga eiseniae]|uniref:Methyltransferase domain-containing protein n=1 Tax=Chitinophaga eiseniae TaxID=634771 RepID=A0A1T4SYY8_9BACT|nr:class I SAM-dependent methyltransferase [Chitinophaga eiseniae]SKA33456.1 Methyltransferase domain-containing protein [Chitinophaga eiseniae]